MIVRELVTKLGFQFDRSNLDKFEKSIIGFKTKATVAFGAVAGALKKGFDFIHGISKASLETKDLADYAGLAVSNLVAMRNAFMKLDVPEQSFNSAIEQLSVSIKEAYVGAGELRQIIHQIAVSTGFEIQFKNANNTLKSTNEVLLQVLHGVGLIADKSERLRILGNLFDPQSAGAWNRAIEQGGHNLEILIARELQFGKAQEALNQDFVNFQKNVAALDTEWKKLHQTLAQLVIPAVAQILAGFNAVIEKGRDLGGGVVGLVKGAAHAYGTVFDQLLESVVPGHESFRSMQKRELNDLADFHRKIGQAQLELVNGGNQNVTINNRFDVNVPAGTPEDQVNYMMEAIVESIWNEKTREVLNNSPVVE